MNEVERGDCTLVLILKVLEDIEESQRSVKEYMEARKDLTHHHYPGHLRKEGG